MASDSQGTEESGNVRRQVDKVYPLSSRAVWGAAGPEQIIEEIREEIVREEAMFEQAGAIGPSLRNILGPIITPHYKSYYANVPGLPQGSPATWVLACGYDANHRPFIVELEPRIAYSDYENHGFHAVGSGAGFAQMANALMAHFDTKERSLKHGLLVAYMVIDAVIATSGENVGPPIQMWVVQDDGAHKLDVDELKEIESNVGGWKETERDALDEFLGGKRGEEPTPIPPEVPTGG